MKTISADFNAINEAGNFWLSCQGSERDLREAGVQVGDWIWLSDGELIVGAQLAFDEVEGPVGIPRWKTLVHLDDDDMQEISVVWNHFLQLPREIGQDPETEARIFQLLTILDTIAPQPVKASLQPGYFPLRRAGALHLIGEPGLALIELEDARRERPSDADVESFYLETLRKVDPDRAAIEADRRAAAEDVNASILAACINIRSAAADQASDEEFTVIGPQILEWVSRFERAPGRHQVRASVLAQVQFNQGLTLLRLERLSEAREAFDHAHLSAPNEPAIEEARKLEDYDENARTIAGKFRENVLRKTG